MKWFDIFITLVMLLALVVMIYWTLLLTIIFIEVIL
jgi:hypothetical protein